MTDAPSARTPYLTEYERRYCTPGAQYGLLLIRGLPDETVLAAARDRGSVSFAEIAAKMGERTNPAWITGCCAETAMERGLIDTGEFDYLSR